MYSIKCQKYRNLFLAGKFAVLEKLSLVPSVDEALNILLGDGDIVYSSDNLADWKLIPDEGTLPANMANGYEDTPDVVSNIGNSSGVLLRCIKRKVKGFKWAHTPTGGIYKTYSWRNYAGARIENIHKFGFGRYIFNASLVGTIDSSLAIWLFDASVTPGEEFYEEIDIVETFAKSCSDTYKIRSDVHFGDHGKNSLPSKVKVSNPKLYHIFSLDYLPGKIEICINSIPVYRFIGNNFSHPLRVILSASVMNPTIEHDDNDVIGTLYVKKFIYLPIDND